MFHWNEIMRVPVFAGVKIFVRPAVHGPDRTCLKFKLAGPYRTGLIFLDRLQLCYGSKSVPLTKIPMIIRSIPEHVWQAPTGFRSCLVGAHRILLQNWSTRVSVDSVRNWINSVSKCVQRRTAYMMSSVCYVTGHFFAGFSILSRTQTTPKISSPGCMN